MKWPETVQLVAATPRHVMTRADPISGLRLAHWSSCRGLPASNGACVARAATAVAGAPLLKLTLAVSRPWPHCTSECGVGDSFRERLD
jgi:hypothetical protein